MSRLKLILFFGLVFVLMGCDKQGDFLGRSNVSASSVLAPLDGVLANLVQDPNMLYASPNTKQTVDIVFNKDDKPFESYYDNQPIDVSTMQNVLAELTPSDSNPVYRYFRYAEGVSIPAYKLLEGTNVTVDKTYKGDTSRPLETTINRTNGQKYDTPSPTSLMPVFGRVLNPNLKRWSSNPELFTLRKDYLTPNELTEQRDLEQKNYLSSYDINGPENLVLDGATTNGDKKPPALIFVLYEPSSYWQTDDRKNRVNDNTLYYFDVYYSIDQWNMFVNKQSGDVKKDNHPDGLRLPNDFGVCKYNDSASVANPITIFQTSRISPQDESGHNPFPTRHIECGLFGFSGHCCGPGGDCREEVPITPKPTVDGDLEFTLITMLTDSFYTALAQKDQEKYKYSQPDVNLWVKHEFIEMLQSGDATFAVTSDKLKPLNEKNRFSPKNNLQVPQWLYSEEAVKENMGLCRSVTYTDFAQCVLDHSRYKVQYTLSPLDAYYHNRTLIVDDTIYERVASPATSNGARAQSAIPDWIWCWFTPE